jgi:hypothetical protein
MRFNMLPSGLAALALISILLLSPHSQATTINVVPVFEPLSLHGTDSGEAVSDVGETLQACVVSRPMALSGAFPESLADAIRSPHQIPSNSPNYNTREANLLVLCNVGISGELSQSGLNVRFQVAQLSIPPGIDLTSKQVLKLAIIALRKTLESYQERQFQALNVHVIIEGAEGDKSGLADLVCDFSLPGGTRRN